MRIFIALILLPLFLTACDGSSGTMTIKDAYTFESPIKIGAVFMTIDNETGTDDTLIAFKTNAATHAELHTMTMDNNTMKMRRVDGYPIKSGETHSLAPSGDHIMVFGLKEKFAAGASYDGIATFEKAGDIPVSIAIRARETKEPNTHEGHHDHDHH